MGAGTMPVFSSLISLAQWLERGLWGSGTASCLPIPSRRKRAVDLQHLWSQSCLGSSPFIWYPSVQWDVFFIWDGRLSSGPANLGYVPACSWERNLRVWGLWHAFKPRSKEHRTAYWEPFSKQRGCGDFKQIILIGEERGSRGLLRSAEKLLFC